MGISEAPFEGANTYFRTIRVGQFDSINNVFFRKSDNVYSSDSWSAVLTYAMKRVLIFCAIIGSAVVKYYRQYRGYMF